MSRLHSNAEASVPACCTLLEYSKQAYYKQMKFVDVETLYGIDSPANFIRFATDHYGELGLSRLNIFASNKR